MPCRDYSEGELREEMRQRIDALTRMLCDIMKAGHITHDAEVWYETHSKKDRDQLGWERENLKQYIAKLEAELAAAKAQVK